MTLRDVVVPRADIEHYVEHSDDDPELLGIVFPADHSNMRQEALRGTR